MEILWDGNTTKRLSQYTAIKRISFVHTHARTRDTVIAVIILVISGVIFGRDRYEVDTLGMGTRLGIE